MTIVTSLLMSLLICTKQSIELDSVLIFNFYFAFSEEEDLDEDVS